MSLPRDYTKPDEIDATVTMEPLGVAKPCSNTATYLIELSSKERGVCMCHLFTGTRMEMQGEVVRLKIINSEPPRNFPDIKVKVVRLFCEEVEV